MFFDILPTDQRPLRSPVPASTRLIRFYRHVFLWVLQGWLAMFYLGAALAKLSQPHDLLAYLMGWPARVDPGLVAMVGWLELALAVGLISPLISWRRCRPVLMLGAAGLLCDAFVMGGYHALAGHVGLTLVNVALVVLAATVLIGRHQEARA
jgi:hypothetical protein